MEIAEKKKSAPKHIRGYTEQGVIHFLFTLPNLILYITFSVLPIFIGIYYSFTNWNGITKKYSFIGLKNFTDAFTSPRFIKTCLFNIRYALLLMGSIVILATILALLLNTQIKGRSFFRVAYFFPAVVSMLTIGLIFNEIYFRGVPAIGNVLGIEALSTNILASKSTAIYGILITNVWKGVAIPTVLILAGLQTIPQDIVESAYLDGASSWQKFRYITVPFILPMISIVLVLVLKEGLMIYDYIVALTGGGPAGATESITMLLYRQGFEDMKFSFSIAESLIVSFVIIAISIIQIEITSKKKVY